MSIFNKCYEYARLRRKGVKIKSALQVFKNPLCELDYILITFIIAFALLAITYHYREEIDNYRADMNYKVVKLSMQNAQNEAMARKNELLVVSMLNGSIIIDGRTKSLCVYDAGGSCK